MCTKVSPFNYSRIDNYKCARDEKKRMEQYGKLNLARKDNILLEPNHFFFVNAYQFYLSQNGPRFSLSEVLSFWCKTSGGTDQLVLSEYGKFTRRRLRAVLILDLPSKRQPCPEATHCNDALSSWQSLILANL